MDIEPVFTKDTKLVDSKSKQYKNIILWSAYQANPEMFLIVLPDRPHRSCLRSTPSSVVRGVLHMFPFLRHPC